MPDSKTMEIRQAFERHALNTQLIRNVANESERETLDAVISTACNLVLQMDLIRILQPPQPPMVFPMPPTKPAA